MTKDGCVVLSPLTNSIKHYIIPEQAKRIGRREVRTGVKKPKTGQLRVWWIPQVPGNAFYVDVASLKEAIKLHDTLARYDLFQFHERVKPDYSNVGGLHVFDGSEWVEWEDPKNGDSIDDIIRDKEGEYGEDA